MAQYITKIRTESGDKQIDYNALANKPTAETLGAAPVDHTHTAAQVGALPSSTVIPTKTSQLTNDSGFKTTDNNTTYTLTKSGSTITLTGSDGSTTSVDDSDSIVSYSLESFDIIVSATELNYCDGVTSNIQTQLNGKAESIHNHDAGNITSGTLPIARGGIGSSNGATGLQNLFASGSTILTEGIDYQYGPSLPSAGNKGRIFFKKVSS